jgi:hypothetical protein
VKKSTNYSFSLIFSPFFYASNIYTKNIFKSKRFYLFVYPAIFFSILRYIKTLSCTTFNLDLFFSNATTNCLTCIQTVM